MMEILITLVLVGAGFWAFMIHRGALFTKAYHYLEIRWAFPEKNVAEVNMEVVKAWNSPFIKDRMIEKAQKAKRQGVNQLQTIAKARYEGFYL